MSINGPCLRLDIEVYDEYGPGVWARERYLVHSCDDVLWTSDLDAAMEFLKDGLECCRAGVSHG